MQKSKEDANKFAALKESADNQILPGVVNVFAKNLSVLIIHTMAPHGIALKSLLTSHIVVLTNTAVVETTGC